MAYTDFLDDAAPSADDLAQATAQGARDSYRSFGNNALPVTRTSAKAKAVKPYDPLDHPDYKAAVLARKTAHDNEMYAHQALSDFDKGEGQALKWTTAKDANALPGDPGHPVAKGQLQNDLLNTLNNAPGSPANVAATRQMQLLAEKRQRIIDEAERTAKARVAYDQQTFLPLRQRLLSQPAPGTPPPPKTFTAADYQAPDSLSPLNDRIATINAARQKTGQPPLAPGSVSAGNFTEKWVPLSTREQATQPPPAGTGSFTGLDIAPEDHPEEFRAAAGTPPDTRDSAPQDVLDPATRRQEQVKKTDALKARTRRPLPWDLTDEEKAGADEPVIGFGDQRGSLLTIPSVPDELGLNPVDTGLINAIGHGVSSLTTPKNVAIGAAAAPLGAAAAAGSKLAKVGAGALSTYFGADMAKAAGEQAGKASVDINDPRLSLREKTESVAAPLVTGGMAALAGVHAGKTAMEFAPGKPAAAAPAAEAPPAPPAATTGPGVEVGGRNYTKADAGWVRDDGTPVDNPTTISLLDTNLLAKTENQSNEVREPSSAQILQRESGEAGAGAGGRIEPPQQGQEAPAAPPQEEAPSPGLSWREGGALDPEGLRFDLPDENGWRFDRQSGHHFNPDQRLWYNPETQETYSLEKQQSTETQNEPAQREPIEPSGSQPSTEGPVPDQGAVDPNLGEPNGGPLQSPGVQPDADSGGLQPRGIPGEAREPSGAGRGIDADGRSQDTERPSGDAGSGGGGRQPDNGQPAEVVGRDAGPVTDTQSLGGSDTGAPSAFTYRETAAGELPEEHASDLAAFQAAENTERTQRGEAPVTLTPQTLTGGKLAAELGIPDGEAGTAEAAKVHDALEKLTGKKIVFVKGSEKLGWEAATLPDKPNTILVNAEAARPFASLTGHEIGHHIKNQRPELYQPFADAVTKALPIPEAYRSRRLAQGYTEDQLSTEWVNDQLGKHFNDPKFWEKLKDNTPRSTFQKIVEAVRDHLGALGDKIKGLLGGKLADPLARDFEKMRGTAADMLRKYTEDTETKTAEPGKLEKASPDETDDSDPTGIKNSAVDMALDEMGLPPATHGEGKTFAEATQQAAKIVKADKSAGPRLLDELEAKPRAPTAVENLVLDHELVKLRNSVKAAYADIDKASASESGEGSEAARLRLSAAQEAYQRAADVVTKAGTASAHSLAFRKAMLKEDFSLAELTRREAATQRPGKPISDLQRVELAELADKYEQASKAYENHLEALRDENSKYAVDKAIHEMVLAEERRVATRKAALERELEILNQEADAAEARLAAKMSARRGMPAPKAPEIQRAAAGEPEANIYDNPEDLRDLAIAAARAKSKRLNVAEELVKRFGPEVTPLLPKILAASDTARAAMKHRAITEQLPKKAPKSEAAKPGTVQTLKERLTESKDVVSPEELSRYARKLAEQHIAAGVRGVDNVAKAVHESLKEALPDLTRREVHDAISMYGQFKPLNKDAIKAHLRDVAGQLQNISKLEDMDRGRAPSKTGVERRVPSDEERRLIKLVEAAKKKGGYNITDPATQLKSATEARQTRLQNQIKDLDFQIKTGRKIVRNNVALPVDKDAAALIKRRDELKKQYDALFPKPGRTDAQRIEASMKSVDEQIKEVAAEINSGSYLTRVKSSKAPTNLALDAKRAELDSLRAQRESLRRLAKPDPTPDEVDARNLAHKKAHLLNELAEGKARLANDDLGPRTRTPKEIKMDDEGRRLQAEVERVKKERDKRFKEREEKARVWWVKGLDFGARFVRGAVLSSPVTFAKLAAATIQQGLVHPMDEMAGSIIKRALPGLAAKAPIEGSGFSAKTSARAIASGIMDGWKDAKDILSKEKGHQSDLDATYGKGGHAAGFLELPGIFHGAEKSFLKRGMFTYAMEKQAQYALDHGLDVSDPLVQMRMGIEAYKYANRKIFQEDNRLSTAFKRGLGALTEKDAVTGRVSPESIAAHTAARAMLPVAKVGTNIIAQTFARALGGPKGLWEAGGAYRRGLENLKPEEADMIMRHLKQGSVGGALLLAGYFLPHIFGGQYQAGEKRKPNDLKPGEINAGGKLPQWVSPSGNIPEYLLHGPAAEVAQFGSSIGRIAHSPERKGALDEKGVPEGALEAVLGLTSETPYIKEGIDAVKAFKPDERIHWAGGFAQSAVPQAVQFAARKMDTNATGATNTRNPGTILEHVKQGIPGLRETVPMKSYVDPVLDKKLGQTGLTIPAPSRPRVGHKGSDRPATDAEFTRFKQTFGAEINELLQKNLPLILSEPPNRAEQRIQMLSSHAHVKARAEMELAARRQAAGTR